MLLTAALVLGAGACVDAPTASAPPVIPPVLDVSVTLNPYSTPTILSSDAHNAFGINLHEAIVGSETYPPTGNGGALLYDKAVGAQSIGTLPHGFASVAYDINDMGLIAGYSEHYAGSSTVKRAFVYTQAGGMIDIHNPAALTQSWARAISPSGTVAWATVVGCGITRERNPRNGAFRWTSSGGHQELVGKTGDTCAEDVNRYGTVVGWSRDSVSPLTEAYVWSASGSATNLGSFGGTWAIAKAINSSGWIVGSYTTASGQSRGFLWTEADGMTGIGPWDGDYFATDINDKGRIIGYGWGTGEATPRAFTQYQGKTHFLPALVNGQPAFAHAVNSCGTIVGTAFSAPGVSQPVRWRKNACD
jgi:probable HAF family extracellular repeat protein